jgi:hypothetical protein
MTYPITQVEVDLYSRIATDAAGAAVRNLATVIPANALRRPIDVPILAWRPGPLSAFGDVTQVSGQWWAYTAHEDWYALTRLLDAVSACYPRDALPFGIISSGGYSQPIFDNAIGAYTRNVTILYTRRGPTYV